MGNYQFTTFGEASCSRYHVGQKHEKRLGGIGITITTTFAIPRYFNLAVTLSLVSMDARWPGLPNVASACENKQFRDFLKEILNKTREQHDMHVQGIQKMDGTAHIAIKEQELNVAFEDAKRASREAFMCVEGSLQHKMLVANWANALNHLQKYWGHEHFQIINTLY